MSGLSRLYQPVVLIVDDDADVLDTMSHMLSVRGFKVLPAANKSEAMATCFAQEGRIDALIADLSIPGDVGGDLERSVAAAYPHIKIIYSTGVPRHIALASGLVRPETPFLAKPVDPDVLTNLLRSTLSLGASQSDSW